MFSKFLIISGISIIVASFLGIFWGIYRSFAALKTNESAGIDAVGGGIQFALYSNIFIFAGIILVVAGAIKLYKDGKAKK